MKTALIMEGGAMRGMFTCGVIDVFLEEDIRFDAAAGISAGAVFGMNYKSGQRGRALRYNKRYSRDPRYCSLRSLVLTGDLYGAEFCYRDLPDVLDPFDRKAFAENPMAFYVGATDVRTGKAVYHRCTDMGPEDVAWVRASASMPIVSRPVSAGGMLLLDGGIVDAVPYRYMESLGYDRNVIVLTRAAGYRKSPPKGVKAMRMALNRWPRTAEAMELRWGRYNRQMQEIDRLEQTGRALVLRPPRDPGISRTEKDPWELQRVYNMGRQEAKRRLEDVRAFLAG
jgi:predicted patatin/cPLA2 family phospholipase